MVESWKTYGSYAANNGHEHTSNGADDRVDTTADGREYGSLVECKPQSHI